MLSDTRRVLSIQSHVVFGYVGNKSATFPLQLRGFDVDAINSVQLSNHTGYGCFKGQTLGGQDVQALVDGLRANALLGYDALLTGYCKNAEFLNTIADVVRAVRHANPAARYVCDPVLGDHGKFYVPAELVGIYRESLLPLATILTPNQFEAEQLSGVRIVDIPSAMEAMSRLHACGAQTVVITSSDLPEGNGTHMLLLASTPWASVEDEWDSTFAGIDRIALTHAAFRVDIPRIDSAFTGTGDLTAALLLAHTEAAPRSMAAAVIRAVATVQAVCRRTVAHRDAVAAAKPTSEGSGASLVMSELRLVQSKADIETPPVADTGLIAKPVFLR